MCVAEGDDPAAEVEDRRVAALHGGADRIRLDAPELLLTMRLEDLRNRVAVARLDLSVESTTGRARRDESALAIVVFPAPMKPTSAMCRSSAFSAAIDALAVGAMRGDEVAERVAAELLLRGDGELPGDRSLRDDGERFDRGDVRTLDERARFLTGRQVDGTQRLHQRRERLHRGTDDDLFAVRDARLDAAGTIGAPPA